MKPIYMVLIVFCTLIACNKKDKKSTPIEVAKIEINNVLKAQEKAWNQHDLEGFMQGYWKNDSLKFYGNRGITYGWKNTLNNYKKGYSTKAQSGILKFVIHDISQIENDNYYVMGEYHLTRTIGNTNGVFIIIVKKINGKWKIIADMSC